MTAASQRLPGLPVRRTIEARWFLRREAHHVGLPTRPPDAVRVDQYHLESMTVASAWKRRACGPWFEYKVRVGPPRPIVVDQLHGALEVWTKQRTLRDPDLDGPWVAVHKTKWNAAHAELCLARLDGVEWWTVAVDDSCTVDDLAEFRPWWSGFADAAIAAAFPAWLIAERHDVGRATT